MHTEGYVAHENTEASKVKLPEFMRENLLNATHDALTRLEEVYEGKDLFLYLEPGKHLSRLGIYTSETAKTSKDLVGPFETELLQELVMDEDLNVMTVQFDDIGYDAKALTRTNSFSKMLKNRITTEVAALLPFPQLKNAMYRKIGVGLPETENKSTTVAPKVFIDYLNPNLIYVGPGSIIGEGAKLQTHFFNPGTYIIGLIVIGDQSVVGGSTRLLPGSLCGAKSIIGSDSTFTGYLPRGGKVAPRAFYDGFYATATV
ncbi:MAG: hypothetical protein GOV00_02755 [Candidatus Altiarchaeota archaeon]|nr:hypothetical protein [Candidatus Altiarchaeota archaeon]